MKALVALTALTGCWTGSEPAPATPSPATTTAPAPRRPHPPPDRMAVAFAKFNEFTDEMCACADQACAMAVSDQLSKWAETEARSGHDPKPSKEQMRQMQELGARLGECMARAMTPPTP